MTFKREERYIVIKRKDLIEALTNLDQEDTGVFNRILREVALVRKNSGKSPLKCVVVERDWPEYEPTWKVIEDRVNNEQD